MKKLIASICVAFTCIVSPTNAVVMQGESFPGVYPNLQSEIDGTLKISWPTSLPPISGTTTVQGTVNVGNFPTPALILSEITAIPAANRTSNYTQADQNNPGYKTVNVVCEVTQVTALQTLTIILEGKNATTGNYYTLASTSALAILGINQLTIPAGSYLPLVWRVRGVQTGGTFGYSCDANLFP